MTNEEWMEFMKVSIASHDRQLGELTDIMAATGRRIEALTGHMVNLADHMAALAATSISHERRLNSLDGE